MSDWRFQRPDDFPADSPLGKLYAALQAATAAEAAARQAQNDLAAQRKAAEDWLAGARLGDDELEFCRQGARLVLVGRALVDAEKKCIRARQAREAAKTEWIGRWVGYQRLASQVADVNDQTVKAADAERQLHDMISSA